jgi:hypothetical protein
MVPTVDQTKKRLAWRAVSAGAAAISVVVTQRVVTTGWRLIRRSPPPEGPADRKVTWGAGLTWAVSMGVGIAVARLVALRLSAQVWEAATHEAPPELT